MFGSRLEPLSPETRELFAKERQYPPQPSQVRARALLRARMTAFRPSTQPRSFWSRPASLLIAAAPVVVAALAFAGFRSGRSSAPRSPELPQESGRTTPLPSQRALPTAAPATAATSQQRSSLQVMPAPLETTHAGTKRRSAATLDAEAELRLLQRARAAVAGGQFTTALSVIADYERRFPSGLLREECEALRIKSLTGLGRTEQARTATEGFREHFPRSVLLRRPEEPAKRPQ